MLELTQQEKNSTFRHEFENQTDLHAVLSSLSQLGLLEIIRKIGETAFQKENSLGKAYFAIADFLLKAGRPDFAQIYYKLSLDLQNIPSTYSAYLQSLLLSPYCPDEQTYQIASQYSHFFSNVRKYNDYPNSIDSKRKLNIGYICHFFQNSISQSVLIPFIHAHHRDEVKVFCYSDTLPHEVPDNIKSCADVWRDTKDLNDDVFSDLLREDKIDILLELNGHCAINRYGVIAKKPVPIQVSFYNISTTSGVKGFDYILVGDEIKLNEKQLKNYTEPVYFLKHIGAIAKFPDTFPEPAAAPCLSNNFITFGSFNSSHKVNYAVIALWAKILKKIPTAKFYMKSGALSENHFLEAYKKQFEGEGINLNRILFEGYSEHQAMLSCYSKMDIALDTFPHAAGTTTLEALWQGVPVLTLNGERYCMQHGRAIVESIGHPEFVSYSEEEFIQKAVRLASNPELIDHYHKTLREDFRKSPKADASGFAKKLEQAYRDMWTRYCDSLIKRE